jgi:nucleoside-diphosphate-sugar epimerase
MRVFVAGASGALGRPLIPRLVEAGHEVTGMTRSRDRAAEIEAAGAAAAVCDVFDAAALERAVIAARPEAVLHALSAFPARLNLRVNYLAETNRVRSEGTRNLLAAARAAGARRIVAESVAFLYAADGAGPSGEDDSLNQDLVGYMAEAVDALTDLERQVLEGEGFEGVVLRLGWFYGPGTHLGRDGTQAQDTIKRRVPIVGGGDAVFSFLHVEDAADAYVAALEPGVPAGAYNVVDDEPAPQREWLPVYAEALGAKPPRRVPIWLARLVVGKPAITALGTLRGATNAKAKRQLGGWTPAHPSWRQGFREALE